VLFRLSIGGPVCDGDIIVTRNMMVSAEQTADPSTPLRFGRDDTVLLVALDSRHNGGWFCEANRLAIDVKS
jgi:hypothetical protein